LEEIPAPPPRSASGSVLQSATKEATNTRSRWNWLAQTSDSLQSSTRPKLHKGSPKLEPSLLFTEERDHLNLLFAGQHRRRREEARGGREEEEVTLNWGDKGEETVNSSSTENPSIVRRVSSLLTKSMDCLLRLCCIQKSI
jgi:hypothetical protein